MIDNGNISDVYRGVSNTVLGERINKENVETVKKWYDICESGLFERAVEANSIGAIFGLKANYGYRDNDNVLTIQTQQTQHESAAEISARYASASLPEKPQFDE